MQGLSCATGGLDQDLVEPLVIEGLLAARALSSSRTRTPMDPFGHPTPNKFQYFRDTAAGTVDLLRRRLSFLTPGGLDFGTPVDCLKR